MLMALRVVSVWSLLTYSRRFICFIRVYDPRFRSCSRAATVGKSTMVVVGERGALSPHLLLHTVCKSMNTCSTEAQCRAMAWTTVDVGYVAAVAAFPPVMARALAHRPLPYREPLSPIRPRSYRQRCLILTLTGLLCGRSRLRTTLWNSV